MSNVENGPQMIALHNMTFVKFKMFAVFGYFWKTLLEKSPLNNTRTKDNSHIWG